MDVRASASDAPVRVLPVGNAAAGAAAQAAAAAPSASPMARTQGPAAAATTPAAAAATASHGPFLPLLLLSLALLVVFGVQSWQLASEQRQIEMARAGLEPAHQSAVKVRSSLDAVATATARLASEGNANARAIVDELRRRGVTINPNGAPKPP